MLAANTLLQGRYRIVSSLGHGGMGAVYEAIDERFGTAVALKEILIELANSTNEIKRNAVIRAFEREAKSLATAKHECIPFVRDYFSELDRQFLVMELVEGEDLAKMLEKRGQAFSLEEVSGWADQLLDALDYLHNLTPPIIHRDIKPQNLKITSRRKIKLLDFGIAKSGDNNSTMTNHTFVGATLNYSPIEQLLRVIAPTFREFIILKHKEEAEKILSQNTDERCDIYALGATFYHLLTNHLPIDSTKRTLEMWEGKPDPLPHPSALNPEIPPSVSACLLKAMEIKRENRYSTALEMQTVMQDVTKNKYADSPVKKSFDSKKTVRLNLAKTQADNDINAENRQMPTPPSPDTKKSAAASLVSAPAPIKIPDTVNSKSIPKPELVGINVFAQSPVEEQISPEIFPAEKKKSKFNVNLLWILIIAVIGIFAVGGIGAMVWQYNANQANSNKPSNKTETNNPVIVAPNASPISSPTISPNVSPTAAPSVPAVQENEKPKPTAKTMPDKTPPRPNPVTKPSPKRIEIPKPEKKITDDCRYNGKCN